MSVVIRSRSIKMEDTTLPVLPNCSCCPYGYHIDIDFVRYCEAVAHAELSDGQRQRRYRRRQTKSMEVMLGLESTMPMELLLKDHALIEDANENDPESPIIATDRSTNWTTTTTKKTSCDENSISNESYYFYDENTTTHSCNLRIESLEDVCNDFERTLERSRKSDLIDNKSNQNEIHLEPEIDCASIASNSSEISTDALQNIREQMSQSLCRMRDLEEQVKIIPMLQLQLSILKEEKRHLKTELEQKTRHASPTFTPQRINSVSLKCLNSHLQSVQPVQTQKCDASVMCSILTRDVGVSTNQAKSRTIGSQSDGISYSEHDIEHLVQRSLESRKKCTSTVGTQMNLKLIDKKNMPTQTNLIVKKSIGTNFSIEKNDFSSIFRPSTRTIGISDDKIDDLIYLKVKQQSIAVGTETETNSISLKQMDAKRSLSFSLGENEKLNLKKNQTTQYTFTTDKKTIGTQSKINSSNKSSTTSGLIKLIDSSINTNSVKLNDSAMMTDAALVRDSAVNTEMQPVRKDVSCGEEQKSPHILIKCADNYCDTCKEHIKNLAKLFSFSSSGLLVEQTNLSRIPRPTALKNDKKLVRQDTYTVSEEFVEVCAELPAIRLSALGSTETLQIKPIENEECEKMCSKAKEPEINKEIPSTSQVNYNKIVKTDTPRKKTRPTKEILGALKVINDSIQKNSVTSNLTNANSIVQKEWFKISSTDTANPLDVEDYLDCFEDYSNHLLRYMVNLIDTNGNTAMHYAVSHGNYDVVSILLDSKVCNVNQKNNAGYTCVMLVSLAKLKMSEHRNVVHRLFGVSDVNLKAKKHCQTALMLAVSHGNIEMVQMLLEAGAEINIQDEDGSTALMCAAEHGRIDIVKILLAQLDCDSSIQDMDGSTALKISLEAGHRDIGVLLYAHNHMSKNKSPYTSLRHKKKPTESKKK